ncbi:MAG: hypothetical protein JNK55_03400 [Rubrivivax sp.]|nr:hypothetical protein [Rubrivivax sp.]
MGIDTPSLRSRLAALAWCTCLAWGAEAAPLPGTQWFNYNQPGLAMDNVLTPDNHDYDAWGSWWDDGSGYRFHGTQIQAGRDHPDSPAGHGYIKPGTTLLYGYDISFVTNAPFRAIAVVDEAFALWNATINGTDGVRNDEALLGFNWRRARPDEKLQIEISWRPQADERECRTMAACVAGYPPLDSFSVPKLQLVFNETYWNPKAHAGAGAWVNSNFDVDTAQVPPSPGAGGQWDHPFDLLSTALHELGHVAGLDDLYNLYEDYDGYHPKGFPGSIMGTSCTFGKDGFGTCLHDPMGLVHDANPYRRFVDLGSLQGVLDLYSIAIPEPGTFVLVLAACAAGVPTGRPRRHGTRFGKVPGPSDLQRLR